MISSFLRVDRPFKNTLSVKPAYGTLLILTKIVFFNLGS